ncbi:hypothetical protein INT45_011118 [Circinella minor]|uniref:Rho-GAP domain-containing protein n=1 Tax=Circinella minor TaxID=1195481 RepID=A0A8H7SFT2_9FUNG|nr:hypothetical protein INT45_011118 [Circinella minor]
MAPSSPESISFHNSDDNENGNVRFTRLMRDTRTKMEAKKLELNATMQEKLPEWKLRGAMYSQYARETGIEWSRKGKETVDRWKKELAERESANNNLPSLPSRQNISTTTPGLIFGVPLEQAIPLDGNLPIVVQRCLDYLDMHGIHEVGIYRIPGSLIAVNKLRAVFDSVPEPIIPSELYEKLNDDKDWMEEEEEKDIDDIITPQRIQFVKQLMKQLPIHHFHLLRRLCRHLKNVSDHSDENRMPTSNLALVFIPTLGIDRTLFHCLVDHYNEVFPSPPVPPTKPRHFKSKTLPDSEMIMLSRTSSPSTTLHHHSPSPPVKPSRHHIKPSSSSSLYQLEQKQKQKQISETNIKNEPSIMKKQPILKPRSKSMSATFSSNNYNNIQQQQQKGSPSHQPLIPSWKRTTGTRVEALGRQFEAKWNS